MNDAGGAADTVLDFDPDALREKYQQERDKRVRADGNAQYAEVEGRFRHFVDDHYVAPGFSRAPLTDDVDLVIIGGGFGGLLMGARAREAGIQDIRVIEAGGDFGGTWYWNRYPGAQCDIESYCYLPLVEELGYTPKEKYSYAPEIYEHSRRIAEHYKLYDNACFQTKVTELRWDEAAARWIVSTDRDDAMRARFVVMATGPLNRPKLPAIPGITDFEGHTFHTSRWDYDSPGGGHDGGLTKLADKRVAIIGTGATAIQSVPHVGASAQQLYVFQRTPSSVDLRGNKPTDPEWAKSLQPGWQRARRENFNNMVIGAPVEQDLVNDGWTDIFRNLSRAAKATRGVEMSKREAALMIEIADFEKMNGIRKRVDDTVTNAAAAEALKPWYRQFCKRPTFNDDYLPTFNRPNVTLIDHVRRTKASSGSPRTAVRGGERHRVRSRLHHLCQRLRGRHRMDAARRLRSDRPRRQDAQRLLVGRDEDLPWLLEPWLPELLHSRPVAERRIGEPDLGPRRPGPARQLHHRAGDGSRRTLRAAHQTGRVRVGGRDQPPGGGRGPLPGLMHARLL